MPSIYKALVLVLESGVEKDRKECIKGNIIAVMN